MKFFKCESCGAIVKEVKPCTCPNCGYTCCGKKMVEIEDPKLPSTGKVLTCSSCGAQVEVIKECTCPNCGIICCGKEMK